MYNQKKAQITTQEKRLRNNKIDPKANDDQAISEKELPHRTGYKDTILEDHLDNASASGDAQLIEKILDERESYVVHRSDVDTSVPPINAVVEFQNKERMDKEWKVEKKDHWSQTMNEKKQQGSLPKTPKNVGQHDKIVLNNDPRRFKNKGNLLTDTSQAENDKNHNKKPEIEMLTGSISKAAMSMTAEKIKTGHAVEYDSAIVSILRDAEKDRRELTGVEQDAIKNLKIARTKAMLKK